MLFPKKVAALAAGFVTVLSIASTAQVPAPASRAGDTLPVHDATIDWIEKSDVAALREGVIDTMELQNGMLAQKGKPIGVLHKEIADLTVKKAELLVTNVAAKNKAEAQRELALAIVATNARLNQRNPGMVSLEEMRKAEAEVKVAQEMKNEAIEKQKLDEADLLLARQALDEHTIRAPFDGIVIERIKGPGESVRANEAVVRLGNLDKLRAWAYIPLEYAYRVKEGQIVELQQKLGGAPIEKKRFRGKITFVDPQIQPIAEVAVRIYAEFDNPDHELRPGAKASMTILLGTEGGAANPTVGSRTPVGLGR
ncbi:RND family efflux transporter, MFP subunit [Singulisphaera sp. GP187]|uniref:efflux RND transporter periplasmic adaptor subunit n=1 Tax=Singulisphaera sp. GP187 TaxID=1882752 RepID=UPI00092849FB|nr:efflux RND transporter periplasmic adaptor subunit [Singulisphaera sp. GP187]SIO21212.1 RND family efflux transporter, MFP subunit [Singulisphaera sp. GP187]